MKSIPFIVLLSLLVGTLSAQITSIEYQMNYNNNTGLFDCYVLFTGGQATTTFHRTQGSSQFSIVLPTGTDVVLTESYNPLHANIPSGSGTVPQDWNVTTSTFAPSITPELDYHSITVNLGPTARYNNVFAFDTVLIFSLEITNVDICDPDIRLWNNSSDPNPIDLQGAQYDHGFVMGGLNQLYTGNAPPISFPSLPSTIEDYAICAGKCAILEPIYCGNASLLWSTGETTSTIEVCPSETTTYTVTINGSEVLTTTVTVHPPIDLIEPVNKQYCIGETFDLGPDGDWVSDDPSIATINSEGIVIALSSGTVVFTYTDVNGCIENSEIYTINGSPNVSVDLTSLCISETAQLQPMIGGTWASNDPSVGIVTDAGLITAVSGGTACFNFTETTTGCISDTICIVVKQPTNVAIVGSDNICIGNTTQLIPINGGVWQSSDASIAVIDNAGLVTGVSAGVVTFTFTDNITGCPSFPTNPVTVNAEPIISITGDENICIGATSQLSPNTGGTWVSSNPGVLSVDVTGLATALTSGFATFTFTDDATGCTATTDAIIVDGSPTVSIGSNDICISEETDLFPAPPIGTWVALDPGIAFIQANGFTVKSVSDGVAGFIYTEISSGCLSDILYITVDPGPAVSIDETNICVNETAQLTPITGGVWSSSDPTIASVNNAGFVVGLLPGNVTFTFTELPSGCQSLPTNTLNVEPEPITQFFGSEELCVGDVSQILPSTGGTWVSSNPAVASIANTGFIIALSPGTTTFTYTSLTTGCVSDASGPLSVNPLPSVSSSVDRICVGSQSPLLSEAIGTWTAHHPDIATVQGNIVTGVSLGSASFILTDNSTGCVSESINFIIDEGPLANGFVYKDLNANGVYDLNEALLSGIDIYVVEADTTFTSNENGYYTLALPVGTYTLEATNSQGDMVSIENVIIDEDCSPAPAIGFDVSSNPLDVTFSITNNSLRCNTIRSFKISVKNNSDTPIGGTVEFIFDPKTSYISSSILPSTQVGNTVTFDLIIPANGVKVTEVALLIPMPDSNNTNLSFTSKFVVDDVVIKQVATTELLLCSFDPNNKTVSPDRDGEANLTLKDEELEYTVRFQNLGNDTAFVVEIIDPIDPNIDQLTFQIIESSHATQMSISDDTLTFIFENVLLPDSMTNPDGSKGFVTFKCSPLESIEDSTVIFNTAHIRFDQNDLITTNTVINTFVEEICSSTINSYSICEGSCVELVPLLCDLNATLLWSDGATTPTTEVCPTETTTYTLTITSNGVEEIISSTITVTSLPLVMLSAESICIGDSIIAIPTIGGTWTSSNETIAQINNSGMITALTSGVTTFIFTSAETGCSQASESLVVLSETDPSCLDATYDIYDQLEIFPNPFSNTIHISNLPSKSSLSIYNSNGVKILETKTIGTDIELDTNEWTDGIYLLQVTDKNNSKTIKLIKN